VARRYSYNSYSYGKKRGKGKLYLFLFFLIVLLAGGGYVYFSPQFEKIPPKIELKNRIYWNPHKALNIKLSDNQQLKSYEVTINDGIKEVKLPPQYFAKGTKEANITLKDLDKFGLNLNAKKWLLDIVVKDGSLWNFTLGNIAQKRVEVLIDTLPPRIRVVASSPTIRKGGSALVVYKVEDRGDIKSFIRVNKKIFNSIKYLKDGYYIALIAWPFRDSKFDGKIVAKDEAGNISYIRLPMNQIYRKYRVTWIRASDKFIDGKIAQLAQEDPQGAKIKDRIERFKFVNEKLRLKNEELIHEMTKKVTPILERGWIKHIFKPLPRSKLVGHFGDERHYYYKDKKNEISTSYHLGYDLASIKHAKIYASNPGIVVYAGYNGIYGNMPIIDHGLGLYTIYGHCSSILVEKGDRVKRGDVIARTGMTGLALGDHLHFGVLVQGVEVLPLEWMRPEWIRDNIQNVLKDANNLIKRRR